MLTNQRPFLAQNIVPGGWDSWPPRSDLGTWAPFIVWLAVGVGGGGTDLGGHIPNSVTGWLVTAEVKFVVDRVVDSGADERAVLARSCSRSVYGKSAHLSEVL